MARNYEFLPSYRGSKEKKMISLVDGGNEFEFVAHVMVPSFFHHMGALDLEGCRI